MTQTKKTVAFNPENGSLSIDSLRYLLIRPETLSEIQKGVEDRLGPKAAEFIYSAGASWAVGVYRRLKQNLPEDPQSIIPAFCLHATQLGWGHWKASSFDSENKKLIVTVENSPYALAYGLSDQPVCHILAGAIGGLAEAIFSMPSACSEQTCKAQSQPNCTFIATGHDVAQAEQWAW
jgi:predicted hydrocarbon binding protein